MKRTDLTAIADLPSLSTDPVPYLRRHFKVSTFQARRIVAELGKISNVVRTYQTDPFDYQSRFLDDYRNRYRIYRKTRQCGFSDKMSAAKGLVKALAIPNYKRIFVSMSVDDAKEKINYANDLYDAIAEEERVPAKVVDNKTEVKFSNGSRLICLHTPRGKANADIDIDEFAFSSDPMKIYDAATPILLLGGTLTIASTVLHSGTMFETIWNGVGGKFSRFVREQIFWWDCPIHCRDVARARVEAPEMSTEDRVSRFGTEALKDIFDLMLLEHFQMEFELRVLDDETALLSWDLIVACTPTGEESLKKVDSIADLQELSRGRFLFAGYDVGRRVDSGELTVFMEDENGNLEEVFFQSFDRTPFNVQEEVLRQVLALPNARMAIDETGIGMNMAENLERSFGHRAIPVSFTNASKSIMAHTMKQYMENVVFPRPKQHSVRFLYDRDRNLQMHSIKREITKAGNLVLAVDDTSVEGGAAKSKHHADKFWSRALGIFCHAGKVGLPTPGIRFIGA